MLALLKESHQSVGKQLRFVLAAVMVANVCFFTGCVRRRLIVRTNPPGASIYVDKQLIGTSPAATPFTYYATREIEAVGDGFRTEKVMRTISPPWYQFPPLDFISETLWPWEIRDERIVDITLVPERPMASEELQNRANSLRLQAAQGVATPLPPVANPSPNVQPVPGSVVPPVLPPGSGVQPPPTNSGGTWYPGKYLRGFLQPSGTAPTRIPEAGILPGGSYRPPIGQ